MKFRIMGFAVLGWLALAAGNSLAASQTVNVSYYWMTGDVLTSTPDGRASVTPSTLAPCTLTANPKDGEKAVAWWLYTGNNQRLVDSFGERIADAVSPYSWAKDESRGLSVIIGLECDWIRYVLQYEGGAATNLVYTNQVTIAGTAQEKTGYLFDSQWTNDVGKVFKTGAKVTGADFGLTNHNDDAVIVLYPVWKANRCSLTYDTADGEFPGPQPTVAVYDTAFEVSDPVRTGYGLKEWSISPKPDEKQAKVTRLDGKTRFLNISAENNVTLTLTAVWTACTYRVTFNNQGASSGRTDPLDIIYGSACPAVNLPIKDGYSFGGYYTAATGGDLLWDTNGQPVHNPWDVAHDIEAFAKWSAGTFHVEYDANGGSGTISAQLVTNGVETVLSDGALLDWPGCKFLGWSRTKTAGEPEYQPGARVTLTGTANIQLYAIWKIPYYIAYDGHGATSGSMDVQECIRGTESFLKPNAYGKRGYAFSGWAVSATDADLLKVTFEDRQVAKGLGDVPGKTNQLYAVWSTNAYHVAFAPGEGSGEPMPVMDFIYDQPRKLPKCTFTPPSELHVFKGWLNAVDGSCIPDEAVVSNLWETADGTNVLTATWKLDVGEWSDHMHCTDLRWGVRNTTDDGIHWEQNDGAGYGCTNTGMSVSQNDGSWNKKAWLQATVPTNGILKFSCRWVRGTSESEKPALAVGLAVDPDFSKFNDMRYFYDDGGVYRSIKLPPDGEWTSVSIEIPLVAEQSQTVIHLVNDTSGSGGYVEIDQMRWIPEGGGDEPPVPTEENAPTVTGADFRNGKFVITSSSDGRFDYRVLTTTSLEAPVTWLPDATTLKPGEDGSLSFEMTVDPAEPQRFYRVEVLQKTK